MTIQRDPYTGEITQNIVDAFKIQDKSKMNPLNHGIFNQDSSFTIQHGHPGTIIHHNGKDYKVTKSRFRCTTDGGIEQADYKDIWERVEPISQHEARLRGDALESFNIYKLEDETPKRKQKKGYWTDDLTRLAEAKKIRTVSSAKLRVKVEAIPDKTNNLFTIRFKDFKEYKGYYDGNGHYIRTQITHPLDIAQIWLRNDK